MRDAVVSSDIAADTLLRFANNQYSVRSNVATDLQQQLCTDGVSTYSSSRLHESALTKRSAPGKHKDLWPLDSRDWWTFGLAAVAIFVAAGGGIGGGGVLVPLFASVLGEVLSIVPVIPEGCTTFTIAD